ncbi:MAG: hypothetical protein SynsKO_11770 [Synoicihabitans sp.]
MITLIIILIALLALIALNAPSSAKPDMTLEAKEKDLSSQLYRLRRRK